MESGVDLPGRAKILIGNRWQTQFGQNFIQDFTGLYIEMDIGDEPTIVRNELSEIKSEAPRDIRDIGRFKIGRYPL